MLLELLPLPAALALMTLPFQKTVEPHGQQVVTYHQRVHGQTLVMVLVNGWQLGQDRMQQRLHQTVE
jgi:hypothetical protein